MREVLVVYLKDTFYAGMPGAAQWHSNWRESGELEVEVRGSGLLWVGKENPDAPLDERGKRRKTVAVFPAGGWSGYCWEPVDEAELASTVAAAEDAAATARARASGIALPR